MLEMRIEFFGPFVIDKGMGLPCLIFLGIQKAWFYPILLSLKTIYQSKISFDNGWFEGISFSVEFHNRKIKSAR